MKEKLLCSVKGLLGEYGDGLLRVIMWLIPSLVIGAAAGAIGATFDIAVEAVTEFRTEHGWILWLLPLAGVAIAAIYRYSKMQGIATGTVLKAIKNRENVPLMLLPVMYASTVLTHLFGGSAGREGAAIQMGGSLGSSVGSLFGMKGERLSIAAMCGSGAFFTALFGTPVTAAIFVLEVADAEFKHSTAILPCLVSSLTAYAVAVWMGVKPTAFAVTAQPFSLLTLGELALLAVVFSLMSRLFVNTMHTTERLASKYLENTMIRGAVGGALVIALTYIVGTRDYNGAGMGVIRSAIEEGSASYGAFILKMIFTAVTIGFGFKGGEVVPSFFIGATLGCVMGPVLGLPPGFAAAVGLVAMFCGCTNAPAASMILGVELYGGEMIIYMGFVCGIVYLFSGKHNLFGGEKHSLIPTKKP